MWFKSDNSAGVSPGILTAMAQCNHGLANAYGDDPMSQQLNPRFSALFETDVWVFPVASGTAANALALSSIAGPFDFIVCHQDAHPLRSESGATPVMSGGAQFLPVSGDDGRLTVDGLASAIDALPEPHHGAMQAGAVTLTQLSEWGTAYSVTQVRAISTLAHSRGLSVHMDGARFANAVASLDVRPADLTWRSGVDILSFGATKNGTMYADAVVFFDIDKARHFRQRLKRSGHALSKSRFMAAQLLAYLEGDLWLHNARHANAMARKMAEIVAQSTGARILNRVDGNIVFAAIVQADVETLARHGITLRRKSHLADGTPTFRLVASFETSAAELASMRAALGS